MSVNRSTLSCLLDCLLKKIGMSSEVKAVNQPGGHPVRDKTRVHVHPQGFYSSALEGRSTAYALGHVVFPSDSGSEKMEHYDLYFPDELHEILLPDFASALSIQTYLRMCDVEYVVHRRSNAEYISPTGRVPLFRNGDILLTGFEEIVEYMDIKSEGLKTNLNKSEVAEMNAFISLIENVLANAEMYAAWIDEQVCSEVTKPRYGSQHTWPLCSLLPHMKQKSVYKVLQARQWADLTEEQVCDKVRQCCEALSVKLGQRDYFFGKEVTPLDALVFGHLFAIVTTILPRNYISSVIEDFDNLQSYLRRVNDKFYRGEVMPSPQHP